ncbi:MAG TPA: hypothetical protein VI408_01840 [Gaiellaceae bacterium]
MWSIGLVLLAAAGLGLRHATDPDHLAAVTALAADGNGGAARLGLVWGLGHGTSLVALGVPVLLWRAYLPAAVVQAAEVTIGVVIVALSISLLRRAQLHAIPRRTPRKAFGIGILHGIGGSGAVGVLLLSTIPERPVALVALVLFAGCAGLSMGALSTVLGRVGRVRGATPAIGVAGVAFGCVYALAAL